MADVDEETYHKAQELLSRTHGRVLSEDELRDTLIHNPEYKEILAAVDSNHDGILDSEELRPLIQASSHIVEVQNLIKTFDLDGDGKLDKDEIEHLRKAYEEKQPHMEVLERWDKNHDGTLDQAELEQLFMDIKSTDTNIRYAGYTGVMSILFQSVRYTAYTSDLGESFRPIIHPKLVTTTYCISWAYVIGDVAWEGWKAASRQKKNKSEVLGIVTERMIFQSLASMLIPMFIIHSTVDVGKKLFNKTRFQRWGPTFLGLSLLPFLPFVVDPPVEHGLEFLKHRFLKWKNAEHK